MLSLDQEAIDNIVREMSMAGLDKHIELAQLAVNETEAVSLKIKLQKIFLLQNISIIVLNMIKLLVLLKIMKMKDTEIAEPVGII